MSCHQKKCKTGKSIKTRFSWTGAIWLSNREQLRQLESFSNGCLLFVCAIQGCAAPASVTSRRLGEVTGRMRTSCLSLRKADGQRGQIRTPLFPAHHYNSVIINAGSGLEAPAVVRPLAQPSGHPLRC